jgi:hypothetical protein
MTDRELEDAWDQLLRNSEEGNFTSEDAMAQRSIVDRALAERRRELIQELRVTRGRTKRAAILERLTEYRRMSDELSISERRLADRELSRRRMQVQKAQARDALRTSRSLTIATWVLAAATVALIVATLAS